LERWASEETYREAGRSERPEKFLELGLDSTNSPVTSAKTSGQGNGWESG